MKRVVVIGAGFGGLTTAAEIARQGLDVTVLEAHVYPGGSAGTFFHQGYLFDAGATLAGGFAEGAPMNMLGSRFDIDWQEKYVKEAMVVHLPDGEMVTRWTDDVRWREERTSVFGTDAEPFWNWQERTAEGLWDLAQRNPEWPPQSIRGAINLLQTGYSWLSARRLDKREINLTAYMPYMFLPVSSKMKNIPDLLRLYINGQLLISAQDTSDKVNALYGAAALDLPRRGVANVPGGMGGMAKKLVERIVSYGGKVIFRKEVISVSDFSDKKFLIRTKRGGEYISDAVVFNQTPWNVAKLLETQEYRKLNTLGELPRDNWGAFVVYAGIDSKGVPDNFPEHHQVIHSEPLGEGNSIFLSISPAWDNTRAPEGKRSITISTHTRLDTWWRLYRNSRPEYEDRKSRYIERILNVAERAFPGIKSYAEMLLPGSPVTFERFTRREKGWVGGFPQTSLFRTWGPKIAPGIWIVGDSIFPGQSVPAVVLGGLRVADGLMGELAYRNQKSWFYKQGKTGEIQCAG
jgi:C-3',4' desaturase CrtD